MEEGGDAAVAAAGDLGVDLCRETEDTSPSWVFWDVEKCPLLKDLNLEAADVFPKIKSILGQWGYQGPVEVFAIGCAEWFSHPTATDLTNTGVSIRPFIYDEFSHIEGQVIRVIEEWILTNPPPANVLFIADCYFPAFFEYMCQHNYNVLLPQQRCRSPEREIYWSPEREDYCWSWVEFLEGRPKVSLKRSRDIGGPSLSEAKRLAL